MTYTATRTATLEAPSADMAVARFFDHYRETAVQQCARRTGDRHLAEDAVQEGFLQVFQRVRRGDDDVLSLNPEGVVCRNARWAASKLMARQRSVSTRQRMLGELSIVCEEPDVWTQVEMRWEVTSILSSLPESQREVLSLRYFHRLPDSVSAARMGLTVKAFRCRVDRALTAARQVARKQAA